MWQVMDSLTRAGTVLFICVWGGAGAGVSTDYEAAFPYTCSGGCEAKSCRTSLCCGGEVNICTTSPRWYQSSREREQQQRAGVFSIFSAKMHIRRWLQHLNLPLPCLSIPGLKLVGWERSQHQRLCLPCCRLVPSSLPKSL